MRWKCYHYNHGDLTTGVLHVLPCPPVPPQTPWAALALSLTSCLCQVGRASPSCESSRHIAGHHSGLPVLPRCEMYLRQDLTVLKLREKFFSFSGDDCTVRDMEGRDWFKIEGAALSITSQRTMTDSSGRVVAGYRKKLLSLYATAYITAELGGQIEITSYLEIL